MKPMDRFTSHAASWTLRVRKKRILAADMNNAGPEFRDRKPGKGGGAKVPAMWQVLAILVLALAFPIIGQLLARLLDVAESSNVAIAGFVLAALLIPAAAPVSLKQLGLVVAIVAAGGTLAILIVLAVGSLAEGLWGFILAMALGGVVGAGFIALSYFGLGVWRRRRVPEDHG